MKSVRVLSVALWLLAACGGDSDSGPTFTDPDDLTGRDAGTQGPGADAAPPVDTNKPLVEQVFNLFFAHCNDCHVKAELGDLQFFTAAQMYSALVNQYAVNLCGDKDRVMVIPGDPDNSLLVQKLEARQDCGTPMPPHLPDALTADEIAVVRDWIAAGAPRN